MEIAQMLDELQKKAKNDETLRQELLDTRQEKNPLSAFCAKCREYGYPIYAMELITAGEEAYAAMRRSTNGGGENSPKPEGEDDYYELFFAGLRSAEQVRGVSFPNPDLKRIPWNLQMRMASGW